MSVTDFIKDYVNTGNNAQLMQSSINNVLRTDELKFVKKHMDVLFEKYSNELLSIVESLIHEVGEMPTMFSIQNLLMTTALSIASAAIPSILGASSFMTASSGIAGCFAGMFFSVRDSYAQEREWADKLAKCPTQLPARQLLIAKIKRILEVQDLMKTREQELNDSTFDHEFLNLRKTR